MRRALRQIERYARHDHATILLEGESGTGKTFLARHLHEMSVRRQRPFVPVPMSTLDDSLAGSDLFGHVTGAFTGAKQGRLGHILSATTGTLFLDEIGKASPGVQCKLLGVVESGEFWPLGSDRQVRVDVRLVAASNVSLSKLVASGDFLPDLEARLSGFRVRIPPLRERRADIPELVMHSLASRAHRCGYVTGIPEVDPELMRALVAFEWPNNLRQLDAVLDRLLVDAEGAEVLSLEHCEPELAFLRDAARLERGPLSPAMCVEAVASGASISEAARRLGVARSTFKRHLRAAGSEN